MSEIMDRAIIGMPYDMAMRDDWSRRQFYNRAQEILAELEVYRAAQQQAEPTMAKNANVAATHSEDGREVPEVVGYGMPNTSIGRNPRMMMLAVDIPSDDQYGGAMWEPLMTVSQHARILAGKDAEISRLSSDLSYFPPTVRALAETISELRAQPARQVGVMPDKREIAQLVQRACSLIPGATFHNAGEEAFDLIAERLNRRAIPAGLLERIVSNNFFGSAAIDELRALLGKEGE